MFFLFPVIKSHHLVIMTFLVFDLDVLFIPVIKSHHLVIGFGGGGGGGETYLH